MKVLSGSILILSSFFVMIPWGLYIGPSFVMSYLLHQISTFTLAMLGSGPSIILGSAGLATYIAGRREYWRVNKGRIVRMSAGIVGAILTISGGFFILEYYGTALYQSQKRGLPWDQPIACHLGNYSPYFVMSALWHIRASIVN